jgi:hypothetical protein
MKTKTNPMNTINSQINPIPDMSLDIPIHFRFPIEQVDDKTVVLRIRVGAGGPHIINDQVADDLRLSHAEVEAATNAAIRAIAVINH